MMMYHDSWAGIALEFDPRGTRPCGGPAHTFHSGSRIMIIMIIMIIILMMRTMMMLMMMVVTIAISISGRFGRVQSRRWAQQVKFQPFNNCKFVSLPNALSSKEIKIGGADFYGWISRFLETVFQYERTITIYRDGFYIWMGF